MAGRSGEEAQVDDLEEANGVDEQQRHEPTALPRARGPPEGQPLPHEGPYHDDDEDARGQRSRIKRLQDGGPGPGGHHPARVLGLRRRLLPSFPAGVSGDPGDTGQRQ